MRRLVNSALVANIVWLDQIDSTNNVASRIMSTWADISDDLLADTVVVAGKQFQGRGRGSNTWVSPQGGLYATWLAWIPLDQLALVPIAAGLACAQAVGELVSGVQIGLKWPNDLYVGGKKLGGILCHARTSDASSWIRAGFGINIDNAPELDRNDVVRAVCLRELGCDTEAREAAMTLVEGFLRNMRENLQQRLATLKKWKELSIHSHGEIIRVRLDDRVLVGRFVGFGEEGELCMDVDGALREIAAGELVLPMDE